jgi:hypothetical protein
VERSEEEPYRPEPELEPPVVVDQAVEDEVD